MCRRLNQQGFPQPRNVKQGLNLPRHRPRGDQLGARTPRRGSERGHPHAIEPSRRPCDALHSTEGRARLRTTIGRAAGPRLVASSAPHPVPDEVHGHRHTGSKERGDTPGRCMTTSVLGRVHEHASGYPHRKSDGDQERDEVGGHNGHGTAAVEASGRSDAARPGWVSRSSAPCCYASTSVGCGTGSCRREPPTGIR